MSFGNPLITGSSDSSTGNVTSGISSILSFDIITSFVITRPKSVLFIVASKNKITESPGKIVFGKSNPESSNGKIDPAESSGMGVVTPSCL